jgi:microcystin-dependent protein
VVNTVTNQPGLGNNGGGPLMSTNATGGDGAHNNMQPSAFWNIIIKL